MFEDRRGLIDDVIHVMFRRLEKFFSDEFFHPARVEVDEVARRSADIREVLDGEPQPPRAGRPHHQPRFAAREMFVAHLVGKLGVIDAEIIPADALLGHPGRAAGLENVERFAAEFRRHPDLGLQIPQPLVLEMRELFHIADGLDFFPRIEIFRRPFEPERAAGFRRKMPREDFAEVRVELGLGGFGCELDHGRAYLKAGFVIVEA